MRWTTGIGIAVGGVGGAIAALLGAPRSPAPLPPAAHAPRGERALAPAPAVTAATEAEVASTAASAAAQTEATSLAAADSIPPTSASATLVPAPLASTAPAAVAASAVPAVVAAPPLDVPTTREALLKAELYCDQRKDFDECARAAQALESGTTGPADLEQAKRFRRIALTHLVMQCESDSAHACFVLAAKYRAGTELVKNDNSAQALEKRGAELCRLGRSAPECQGP